MIRLLLILGFVFLLNSLVTAQSNRYRSFFSGLDSIRDKELVVKKLQEFKQKKKLNNKEKSEFYRRIIVASIEAQKFDLSLKYGFEAQKFAEKIKDDSLLCVYTNQLGGTYYYIHKKKECTNYYEQAAQLAHKNHFWDLEAKTLSNLGVIYLEDNDFKKAEEFLKKAIALFKEHNVHHKQGLLTYRLLATLYTNSKEYEKARPIFTKIIELSRQIKDTNIICSSLTYYADFLSAQGQNKEATTYSSEALKLQRTQHDKTALVNNLIFLGSHYVKNGEYKKAAEAYDEVITLNNQIFQDNLKNGIVEVEVKYKTAEIKRQKELAEAKALSEERKNKLYLFISIGVILILIIVFLLIFLRQQSKRRSIEAAVQKQHLEAILAAQEEEKVRIARDLHDGICQKFAATKMKFSAISKDLIDHLPELESNYASCVDLLDEATNELRGIAHEIMPPSLKDSGLDEAMKQLCFHSFSNQLRYSFEVFGKTEELSQETNINIYRIAQELFANILKHAGASEVSVQLIHKASQLILHVEDNGLGFKTSGQAGMGLANIAVRTELIKAKFNIEPGANSGTLASLIVNKPN